MRRIADQLVAIEPGSKDFFAKSDAVFLTHFVDTVRFPGFVQCFHNKGRHPWLEPIRMRLEPTVFGFYKRKGKGIKCFFGTQPYETTLAHIDVGLECILVASPNFAV